MLSDVTIQKTKISLSMEKLQVHFRSGVGGGDSKVVEAADELITELDALNDTVKDQTTSLEACLAQLDQYQQVRERGVVEAPKIGRISQLLLHFILSREGYTHLVPRIFYY